MQFFALSIFLGMSAILTMIPSVSAEDYDISITDDKDFLPEDLTINVGDAVTWTNDDDSSHTVTADNGQFDSGNMGEGATWSHTFTEAGTYDYKCNYHSSMTGTVTVVEPEGDGEDPVPRTDSDWFNWTMNGTHHSVLAITNESLNWTHSIVSIYNETGAYMQPSLYNAVEYESDLEMNHTWLDNGTYFANITLYNNEDILAYHNWTFLIEGATENEESPDGDNDGIADEDDSCPSEDSSGHDADADGCIDDSDNDGVKDDVDVCPFDSTDGCPAALQDVENVTEDIPGCIHQSAENYNSEATEDDGSCKYEEDSPGFGIFAAIISISFIAFIRKREL